MKLTWTPDLKIGHDLIDQQHIQLFSFLDEFSEGCATGRAQETLILLHGKLKDYADAHFCEEEELMKRSDYPEIERHQNQHRAFQKDIMELEEKISAKNLTMLDVMQMNKFLVGWLVNHVKESDQRLGKYLKDLENR